MRKTLLILISVTLLLAGQVTAIDLNSSRALQYYGAANTDGNLDFEVGTDGTVDVYGGLDMSGNSITGINGLNNCTADQALLGDGSCGSTGSSAEKDLTTSGGLTGGQNDVLAGTDGDVDLSIASQGVGQSELNTNVAGTGLSGGGGNALSVNWADADDLDSNGDLLTDAVQNGELVNNQVTVSSGNHLSGGGNVFLGGSTTLDVQDDFLLNSGDTMNGDLNMSGNNITNVAEPDSPQDAATKKYVDTLIYGEGVNRTIFVTNSSYASDLGGLSGADNKCQTEANNAGMSGSYKAVLSTGSVDAIDRFDWAWHDRIANPAGEVVARNDYKLWKKGSEGVKPGETLATPIQTGAQSGTDRVWTGTKSNGERATGGTPTHHCSGWTNGDLEDDAYVGNATETNNEWIANGEYEDCRSYSYARLYCLETK